MPELIVNSETAAASQDRGGLSGRSGRIALQIPFSRRPALHAAGALVFLRPAIPRAAHSGKPPLAPTRAARQSRRAPHR